MGSRGFQFSEERFFRPIVHLCCISGLLAGLFFPSDARSVEKLRQCEEYFSASTGLVQSTSGFPEWWDNDLGLDDVVLPGFSPVSVVGTVVELSERVYAWKDSFLPQRIESRGALLVRSMRLMLESNGVLRSISPDTVEAGSTTLPSCARLDEILRQQEWRLASRQ